jgi:hypothetical protein
LRATLAKPRVPPGRSLLPEPDDALPAPDFVALTDRWLGRDSLERRALLILVKPGMSIRELCRERVRWWLSRTSLYRRARRGARIVAQRLEAEGIAPPLNGDSPAE